KNVPPVERAAHLGRPMLGIRQLHRLPARAGDRRREREHPIIGPDKELLAAVDGDPAPGSTHPRIHHRHVHSAIREIPRRAPQSPSTARSRTRIPACANASVTSSRCSTKIPDATSEPFAPSSLASVGASRVFTRAVTLLKMTSYRSRCHRPSGSSGVPSYTL